MIDLSVTLYVSGTPIGNMEDITLRALRILKEVDIIAAEDTRQSVKLLNHYEIKTPLTSYHEHNKYAKAPVIIKMLEEGKNVAIVTDAGMPGISDPGEDLIRECVSLGIPVTAVPGPTAVITGLVLSALPCARYCFEAFLPQNHKQRKEIIEIMKKETRTTIIYEAPHRLTKTLGELHEELGERKIAVIKELTKKHENTVRGTIGEVRAYFEKNEPKGEFVIAIEGISSEKLKEAEKEKFNDITIEEHYRMYTEKGMTNKDSMKAVAKDRNIGKREVYDIIMRKGGTE